MAKSTPPSLTTNTATAVALYARVSTEDQAERGTVQSQLDFLRRHCELYGVQIVGEYIDDGISGAVALDHREAGQRLLTDAEAGRFGAVLVYRLDRLARDLRILLDTSAALERLGVALKSATEPLDTATAHGRLILQMLGSFAEFEKNSIKDRMSVGRDRVAGIGKYTGGPIPYGYDVDEDGLFVPSARLVPQVGVTEAELVREIFHRIASGETSLNAECRRLTDLGVPRQARYAGKDGKAGAIYFRTGRWSFSSLSSILHNPAYKGEGMVKSRFGEVPRPMPVIVEPAVWDATHEALIRNRTLSRKNAKRTYHLRGLMRCGICRSTYVGTTSYGNRKYRCRRAGNVGAEFEEPCRSRRLDAEWIEAAVWEECRHFILNPGDALDEARRKLRESMGKAAGFDDRRRTVLGELAAKERERERILTLFRRGTITADEAEGQLEAIAREAGHLRESLESMRAQAALLEAQEAFLTDSALLLVRLRDELEEIEQVDDWARKRDVIERYVRQIVVETRDTGKRRKEAVISLYLRLRPAPIAVVSGTGSARTRP